MHETNLIVTLTCALAAGLTFGYLTNLLRLSPIVGYLIAGIAIGPFTPGFIADQAIAVQLAEIGVMLLMFGVGLHFHVEDLWAVRRIALPGAVAQIAVATFLGAITASFFGWSWHSGFVYGLCLAVASTVVLTRILVDNRQLHTPTGHVAVGWLIVEDLFTVLVLVMLPIITSEANSGAELLSAFGVMALKLLGLGVATFILGAKVVPWFFGKVARTSSQELFTLTVLVTVLGVAVSSSILFNVSMALGAFLAGTVVGKSEFSLRAASEILPMRDAFAVLFFVSVGMLLDPSVLIEHAFLIAATLVVVLVGKTVAAFAIVLLLGYPLSVALGVSVALAQIGEFSFILASLARQLGIFDEVAINALVAVAILSITMNPILFRLIPRIEDWIVSRPRLHQFLTARLQKRVSELLPVSKEIATDDMHRAIIVGYGPSGRMISRLLKENGVETTIIELNLETIRFLKSKDLSVVYGDASQRAVLESAGILHARTLILSATSIAVGEEIARQAKTLNPSIRVIARTSYMRELSALKRGGCEAVFSGEGEGALALVESVLNDLGVSKEKIELERQRIRNEVIDSEHEAAW